MEGWFKTPAARSNLLGRLRIGRQEDGIRIYPRGEDDSFFARCTVNGKTVYANTDADAVRFDAWQHLAIVHDGKKLTTFVDGRVAGQSNAVGTRALSSNLRFGWGGQADEIRVSSVARYDSEFTPKRRFVTDEHTLALYHCDEGSGNIVRDASGNGHDGELTKGVNWVPIDVPESHSIEHQIAEAVLVAGGRVSVHTVKPIEGRHGFNLAEPDDLRLLESSPFAIEGITSVPSNRLSDEHLAVIGQLGAIRNLHLWGCRDVTDRGVHALRELQLTTLALGATSITNDSIPILANMTSLRVLHINVSGIDDTHIMKLARLGNLTDLRLHGTQVTEDAIKRLHAAIPHCKIESPFGDLLPIANYAIEPTGLLKDKARIAEMPQILSLDDPMTIEMTIVPRAHAGKGESRQLWSLAGKLDLKQYEQNLTWEFFHPNGTPRFEAVQLRDMPLGKPLRIAGVSTGKVLRLYINGKLVKSHVLKNTLPNNRPPMIPAGWGDGTNNYRPFDGTIDEIRISKTIRYDSDYQPVDRFEKDEDTLALYHCDEGSGKSIKDSSGNGFHLEMLDGRWVNFNNPKSNDVGVSATPSGIVKLRHTIVGPKGPHFKSRVAITPNGKSVAFRVSGTEVKGVMTLADVETGTIRKQFTPHATGGYPIAFSPDGKLLATGGGSSTDTNLKLWPASSLEKQRDLVGLEKSVAAIAFSPDGRRLASVGGGNQFSIILWDVETGRFLHRLGENLEFVGCVAFSPDGTRLAVGSGAGDIVIFDVDRGTMARELPKQETESTV
jgi:hypothetical protein